MSIQRAMRADPPVSNVRRPNLSARKTMKKVHAMTLTAPKRPVRRRSRLPLLPTSNLKYCGPKTARALLPVVFWNMNSEGPMMNRRRLEGCQSSRKEKPSLAAASALRPSCVSLNSAIVFSPSSPRIQVIDFHACSVLFLVRSQRTDSGRVRVPSRSKPLDTSCRPTGICHSRDWLAMVVF